MKDYDIDDLNEALIVFIESTKDTEMSREEAAIYDTALMLKREISIFCWKDYEPKKP